MFNRLTIWWKPSTEIKETVSEPACNVWLEKHHWEILGHLPARVVRCLKCRYEENVIGYVTVLHPVFDRTRHKCQV